LKTLIEYIEKGEIRLHLTDITIREIEVKILELIQEAEKPIKTFHNNVKILRGVSSFAQLFNIDIEIARSDLKNQFNNFMDSTQTIVISTEFVSIPHIFNKYFNQQPPFTGGKKKYEFPDAFVIKALEDYCTEAKSSMYVISKYYDLSSSKRQSKTRSVGCDIKLMLVKIDIRGAIQQK
jgi:hypothetical protein